MAAEACGNEVPEVCLLGTRDSGHAAVRDRAWAPGRTRPKGRAASKQRHRQRRTARRSYQEPRTAWPPRHHLAPHAGAARTVPWAQRPMSTATRCTWSVVTRRPPAQSSLCCARHSFRASPAPCTPSAPTSDSASSASATATAKGKRRLLVSLPTGTGKRGRSGSHDRRRRGSRGQPLPGRLARCDVQRAATHVPRCSDRNRPGLRDNWRSVAASSSTPEDSVSTRLDADPCVARRARATSSWARGRLWRHQACLSPGNTPAMTGTCVA